MLAIGKCFRSDELNQALLLPPSLHDWLPEKHLARFLVDVVDALDLEAIHASYDEKDGRGQAAYAPAPVILSLHRRLRYLHRQLSEIVTKPFGAPRVLGDNPHLRSCSPP
jgi:hypothetical protein